MCLFMCLMMAAVSFLLFSAALIILGLITIGYFLILQFRKRRLTRKDGITVGIFHPYCNAGGGGEKVLWSAIRAVQKQHTNVDIIVYTGDTNATPQEILQLASERLNITLPRPVQFVYLRTRSLVEAWRYPVCTLLGQSLGSILVGIEAMWRCLPDVYIDTMGYAFTMPLFAWLGGCRVGCYVHYPIITTDMLKRVSQRVEAHNNRALVARSPLLTSMKVIYYRTFAWLYRIAGRTANVVMVNSSWAKGHILELWGQKELTRLVYPPGDLKPLEQLEHTESDEIRIVSLGQFRPEKDHPLQIKALKVVKDKVPEDVWKKVKLVVIGSCRNSQDEERVNSIKELAENLSVSSNVEFRVNISFEELVDQFKLGTIGLHTMWNEHFGICVVECMAAGLVMVAHRSGGPMMDIIVDDKDSRTGFLAETAEEYANAIIQIINTPADNLNKIRKAARLSMKRFSVENFEEEFLAGFNALIDSKKEK